LALGRTDPTHWRGGAYPPVNLYESAEEVVVQCEVPGVELKDLDVSITGETLTIKGIKRGLEEGEVKFVRRERGSGEFTRTIVLPDQVEAERVEAELRNGILRIRLPKSPATRPRQIEIKPAAKES